jgi:hypothetical protein
MTDAEGSELLAEVFNRMTMEQKNSVPGDVAERIGRFMVKNGYRLVFTRWYLQAPPDETPNAEVTPRPVRAVGVERRVMRRF